MRRAEVLLSCLATLTEEHFQFNETAHEVVKVDGVLSVSVTVDDGVQHRVVHLETWGSQNSSYFHFLLYCVSQL